MLKELSTRNPYYIPKHRYLELKHYCLQYSSWRRELASIYPGAKSIVQSEKVQTSGMSDQTAAIAIRRTRLEKKIQLVEQAALKTDGDLYDYILLSVTSGASFEYLQTVKEIPCCRNTFYDRYRKFFWVLDKLKD